MGIFYHTLKFIASLTKREKMVDLHWFFFKIYIESEII